MAFKFESLEIWKLALDFANEIYGLIKEFPNDEKFELASQVRRSASSIPANIAEGSGGSSVKDFQNFLDIALKSVYETISHLALALRRGYIVEEDYENLKGEAETLVKKIKSFKSWLDKSGKF